MKLRIKKEDEFKLEVVQLPGGNTCFPEYEKEALGIYQEAYDRNFDGFNYEYAESAAIVAMERFLKS